LSLLPDNKAAIITMSSERTIFNTWSKERLINQIDSYFSKAKKNHSDPSMTGLALHLGCTRKNLIDYKETDEFGEILTRAKLRCENTLEEKMIAGTPPTGIMFILKNNYGWNDKVQIDQTVNGTISLAALFGQAAAQKAIQGRKQEVVDGEIIETPTNESIFDSKLERTIEGQKCSSVGRRNELPSDLF